MPNWMSLTAAVRELNEQPRSAIAKWGWESSSSQSALD
jgi:hypothetical protein